MAHEKALKDYERRYKKAVKQGIVPQPKSELKKPAKKPVAKKPVAKKPVAKKPATKKSTGSALKVAKKNTGSSGGE